VDSLADEDIKEPSREVLTAELESLLPKETDLKSYNEGFLNSHKDSPKHVHGGWHHIAPAHKIPFILTLIGTQLSEPVTCLIQRTPTSLTSWQIPSPSKT